MGEDSYVISCGSNDQESESSQTAAAANLNQSECIGYQGHWIKMYIRCIKIHSLAQVYVIYVQCVIVVSWALFVALCRFSLYITLVELRQSLSDPKLYTLSALTCSRKCREAGRGRIFGRAGTQEQQEEKREHDQ